MNKIFGWLAVITAHLRACARSWTAVKTGSPALKLVLPPEEEMQPSEASEFDEGKVPGIRVSRDFKHCHPILVERFKKLAEEYVKDHPGRSLIVTCTFRSVEEQKRLYAKGRTAPGKIITNADGVRKRSLHNHFPARAIDCAVSDGGKVLWDEDFYWPILPLARKHELISGGSWVSFQDWPHVELPRDIS